MAETQFIPGYCPPTVNADTVVGGRAGGAPDPPPWPWSMSTPATPPQPPAPEGVTFFRTPLNASSEAAYVPVGLHGRMAEIPATGREGRPIRSVVLQAGVQIVKTAADRGAAAQVSVPSLPHSPRSQAAQMRERLVSQIQLLRLDLAQSCNPYSLQRILDETAKIIECMLTGGSVSIPQPNQAPGMPAELLDTGKAKVEFFGGTDVARAKPRVEFFDGPDSLATTGGTTP